MRLIPKKTRVSSTVWGSFTLFDLLLAFAIFACVFGIVMSNLPGKWIILIIVASFSVMLFFPSDDGRAYNDFADMIKYLFSRKKFRSDTTKRSKHVGRLVPFTSISEDGVIDYGEYVGAILSIGAIEFGLLAEFEQNRRISAFANMLSSVNETTVVQLLKIDRPINYDAASQNVYDQIVSGGLEITDKAQYAVLRSRLEQLDELNNVMPQYRPYYYLVVYDSNEELLSQIVQQVQACFFECDMKCDRLDGAAAAVCLRYSYLRDFDERNIDDVDPSGYADYIKPDRIRFTSSAGEIDGVYTCVFAINDYPLTVGNAWGAGLFNIDGTKVVMTLKSVPKQKAVKRIDRTVVEMSTRSNMRKASQVISTETHLETMGQLLQNLQNESETLLDCTITVTAYNFSGEKTAAFRKSVRRAIVSEGFSVSALRGRQLEGFIASSLSRRCTLRNCERGINSESAAAVFPFVFTSTIEPDGYLLGEDHYPVILNIWKRGPEYTNSNMMVLGKSGSGKSYFTKTLLSMIYSENSRIFILDPENEYSVLCRNVGGRFIDVGNATSGRINPLHVYQILTEDGLPAPADVVFFAHLRFVESFFKITLPDISADSLELLNNEIVEVYRAKGITESTDCTCLSANDYPTFDDLKVQIAAELGKPNPVQRHNDLIRIATYIEKFASGGRYSNLWNGPSTLTAKEKMIVFNFQSLLENKNTVLSNAQMLVVMRYLEQQIINIRELNRNAKETVHPFVAIDEGYNFINPDYPIALDFIFQWYKRIRKYDGSIMFLTQNLSDVLGNPEVIAKTSAIINNTQYSFIFGLAPGDVQILIDLYKNAGEINETEQNQISTAGRGTCFLIATPQNRSLFHVSASETVQALFEQENMFH